MWRRRSRPTSAAKWLPLDVHDALALQVALAEIGPRVTELTINMCWHDGRGHDYPVEALQAAGRLRARHDLGSSSNESYTSLTFSPSPDDFADFLLVAPYCDLAYATDAAGAVLLDVSGEGSAGSTRDWQTESDPGE